MTAKDNAPATPPRCKTCSDSGWVMAYDQIEPGISVPSGDPCPDCDGPAPAPARSPGSGEGTP